jgi:hypothetical protein
LDTAEEVVVSYFISIVKVIGSKIAISGNKRGKAEMNLNNFNISAIGKIDPEHMSINLF